MANTDHVEIVRLGAEAIEDWRKQNPNIHLDLQNADLRRVDLSHANLNGADLSGANLEWTDFRWADLIGANLSEANLQRADFHKADLFRANLIKADLANANFEDANLREANLSEAQFCSTRLINVDLAEVQGLENSIHSGPSVIDIETLSKSGYLPSEFLRGCGLSDAAIRAAHAYDEEALMASIEANGDYYSCFISYSSQDEAFATQLCKDLQERGVRCWFAPKDMKIGDKIRDTIHRAIRKREKLLLILSENSVSSDWVESEVEKAISEERDRKDTVIFPVRIDDAVKNTQKAWAEMIRLTRHIGDFRNWKNRVAYEQSLERLLGDLRKTSKQDSRKM